MWGEKQENTEEKRVRVPMYFRTKRFNLKKIPPPPPILNPYIYETSITYLSDICQTCIT